LGDVKFAEHQKNSLRVLQDTLFNKLCNGIFAGGPEKLEVLEKFYEDTNKWLEDETERTSGYKYRGAESEEETDWPSRPVSR